MPICHGRVKIKKIPKVGEMEKLLSDVTTILCKICYNFVEADEYVSCISPNCLFVGHLRCLAKLLLEPGQYVPIQGICPSCKKNVLWGDLIRKKNGCSDLEKCDESDIDEDTDDIDLDRDDVIEFL